MVHSAWASFLEETGSESQNCQSHVLDDQSSHGADLMGLQLSLPHWVQQK